VGIVVVTGPAGIGKSSFAVHLAHQLSHQFPDGQLFAHLRGTELSPAGTARILGRFLRDLGLPGTAVPTAQDDRVSAFRSLVAGRRMLVLLDDAVSEQQVQALLPGTAGHLVVVTSRRRLTGLPGARHVEVGILPESASVRVLTETVGAAAVAASPAATRALIDRCGGLPLALRIAAARLAARPHWMVEDLLERLDDEHHRLDEFVHGEMCVRSSIAITYDALSDPARRLFRLLGLPLWWTFPEWAAAPLLDVDNTTARELLEVLLDARAVEVVPGERGTVRMHGLVRAYARERLAEEEPAAERMAALRRLLGCQLYLTGRAHRLEYGGDYTILHSPAPRWISDSRTVARLLAQPLSWMDGERVRIVESVGQATRAGLYEYAWDLAISAVFMFERGMHFDDWRESHELALSAAHEHGDLHGEAAMRYSLGALAVAQLQPGPAVAHLVDAERLFVRLNLPHGRGLALRNLAFVDRLQGRHDSAVARYREALGLLRSVGDRVGEAHVLVGLARIRLEQDEPDGAGELLDEALVICRAVGNRRVAAQVLVTLGEVRLQRAEYEDAGRDFAAVLTVAQQTADSTGAAYARLGLGLAVLRQGGRDDDEGRSDGDGWLSVVTGHLDDGLRHARRVGDRMVEARLLLASAEAHAAAGRPTAATADLTRALGIFTELGARRWQAVAHRQLAEMHLAVGDEVAGAAARSTAAAILMSLSDR
jgi:tetratricopeptide (TPR) repeat protein